MNAYVFDFDGVLVDTEALVRKAYREVGVTMPEGAWGKPWWMWLDDPSAHARKTVRYVEMIRNGELSLGLLPPLDVAVRLMREGASVFILTGASREVVTAFQQTYADDLRDPPIPILDTSCDFAQKLNCLLSLSDCYERVVYVDDDRQTCEDLNIGWSNRIRVVHYERYTDPSYEAEARRVYQEVMRWTPLS